MRTHLKKQSGMSLVEATIILMVLAVLTGVLAPGVADYVNDARDTKVKEDIEAFGISIMRLLRDSRESCLLLDASSNSCTLLNRVDLLYSDGANPTVSVNSYSVQNVGITGGDANWLGHTDEVPQKDTAANQLILNTPSGLAANQYDDPTSSYATGGPRSGIGWRGAYLAAPVGPDPWGNAYQSNTAFLNVANNNAGSGEGQTSGGWRYDTIVISSGRNGAIETQYALSSGTGATVAGGDDVVYVVTGSTR